MSGNRHHALDICGPCPTVAQKCAQNGRRLGVGKKESPQLIRVAGFSMLASPRVENQELYDANQAASEGNCAEPTYEVTRITSNKEVSVVQILRSIRPIRSTTRNNGD